MTISRRYLCRNLAAATAALAVLGSAVAFAETPEEMHRREEARKHAKAVHHTRKVEHHRKVVHAKHVAHKRHDVKKEEHHTP